MPPMDVLWLSGRFEMPQASCDRCYDHTGPKRARHALAVLGAAVTESCHVCRYPKHERVGCIDGDGLRRQQERSVA